MSNDNTPTVAAVPAEPVALWQYRWTNPGDDPDVDESDTAWKLLECDTRLQTLEQRIEELRRHRYAGKPCYEVRPLYAAPQATPPAPDERHVMQLAGISTAAYGYWKEGDSIHPDYDTVALRDVAKLYAKYAELYEKQSAPPAAPAPAPEPGFVFQVGQQYETQAGKLVTVLGRITLAGAQCLICSDEKYRYDRLGDPSDAGRVTGTPHDYSWPGNFKRNVARAAAPAPAVNQELLEKLTAWQAVCDRITDQYGGVVAGVDFGALGRATRAAITRAESGAPAPAPQPQPQPLTDERIEAIAHRKAWRYRHDGESTGSHLYTFNRHTLLDFAHALGITGGATGDKA